MAKQRASQPRKLTAKDTWPLVNRGIFRELAAELKVSESKVRFTYRGFILNPDPRVVEALAQRGAPGFSSTTRAA